MIGALFKSNMKAYWPLFLFVVLILLLYGSISVYMFDPSGLDALVDMLDVLPEGMVKAMGFDNLGTDLTYYIASYLYGFIMIIFPGIYISILANNLVAKQVERGSMAYLLTTPNTRIKVALTQAVYLLLTLAVHIIILTGVVILMCVSSFPGRLEVGKYIVFNILTYLVLAVTAGIAFIGSTLLNESRWSLAVGAGIPSVMFILKMIYGIDDSLSWVRYLTVFSLIDLDPVIAGEAGVLLAGAGGGAILLFGIGIGIFHKRSLAL